MENGQAESGPENLDDLASFLVDNPRADTDEDKPNAEEPSDEDNSEDENPDDAPADEEDEESESEDAEKQTSGLKFKVPVKGEDGTESMVEVDQKELIAGYQRHSDYTRKTMELADRERTVTQRVAQELQQGQSYYVEQAQLAQAAVRQLAGLRSPQEMAQLAQVDPAAWVQEQQRTAAIHGVMQQLEQGMQHERQQVTQQQAQDKAEQYQRAWVELGKEGIDKPKLAKIFDTIGKTYGVAAERFANVDDPAVVRIMRDAAAYAELKEKRAAVTKKVQEAPKLPAPRQSVPKNEQRAKSINQRFATGKAKLGDLASYLENM